MRFRLGHLWAILGACGAACGEEFPNEPSQTVLLQPAEWPGEVFATDVDTIAVDASLLGSGTQIKGLRLTWQSSDDEILRVVQLQPADGANREDTLAAQLRAVVTGRAGGLDTVSVLIEGDRAFEPVIISDTIRVVQKWVSVSAGYEHSCGVTIGGEAFCWGEKDRSPNGGLLGDGSSSGSLLPVRIIGGLDFSSVAAGDRHSCGALVDGRVYCWGLNLYGAIGDGSRFDQLAPVPVSAGHTFDSLQAGSGVVCGVSGTDGLCWGLNDRGQLGDAYRHATLGPIPPFDNCAFAPDSIGCSRTPRQVRHGVNNVPVPLALTAVAPGELHTCALTTSHAAICWGELPRIWATLPQSDEAVVVTQGLTFRSVSSGAYHTCAIGSDSKAYCWGHNFYGQLGVPDINATCGPSCSRDPVALSGGYAFQELKAGHTTTCGITTEKRAVCWGSNLVGQLGTLEPVGMCPGGTFADGEFGPAPCARTPAAVAIPGSAEVLSVSVGPLHGCAVRSDGAAFCWGDGLGGELGNNARLNSAVPVRVSEPLPVSASSAPE